MSENPSKALTEFLKGHVGQHLRSVLRYDDQGGEFLYLRDDVAEQYSDDEIEDVVREARLEGIDRHHQESLYDHGSLDCTVRSFEEAVEMHFARDETSGTAVALDGEVFAVHNTFLGRCIELMDD